MTATPDSRPRRRWRRFLLASGLLWFGAGAAGAAYATRPCPAPIPARAEIGGHAVADVQVRTSDGLAVRGWLAVADPGRARCVVLAAGIHGNRLAMLARAEWYLANGWSTLLVDLRGTGASQGARISMGLHEAKDLLAWRLWLRARGFAQVGAHGQSLGAAAVVYSATLASRDAGWDFAVLESCYDDIDTALHNRLPWMPLPRLLLWPLRQCGAWLMQADTLRPVDAIAALRAPTLLACGDQDRKVGAGVTEALLRASGAARKRLVFVRGVGHTDLWSADTALRNVLAGFLDGL